MDLKGLSNENAYIKRWKESSCSTVYAMKWRYQKAAKIFLRIHGISQNYFVGFQTPIHYAYMYDALAEDVDDVLYLTFSKT